MSALVSVSVLTCACQLQTVASLKVTIQQRSDSREFGRTDRRTDGLRCHVCDVTCRSLQVSCSRVCVSPTGSRLHRNFKLKVVCKV